MADTDKNKSQDNNASGPVEYKYQNSIENMGSPTMDDLVTPPKFFDTPKDPESKSPNKIFSFTDTNSADKEIEADKA